MTSYRHRLLIFLLCWLWQPLAARDHTVIIGGGWDLSGSEAQIEQNVLWAREVLRALPGQPEPEIYFTDGDDPAADVLEWQPVADEPATLQPLARIYDSYWVNGERYRNHRVKPVAGGTHAEALTDRLTALRSGMQPADRLLLIFNGHGGEADSPDQTYLMLWGGTELNVLELDEILAAGPPEAPTRFVFTQCYSGGFNWLVYADADPQRGLSRYRRCGFTAVPADLPAEGCSAAIDAGDYRDYSTFFFAALHGESRVGTPLAFDPDADGDGTVTPFEAHLYTLRAGRSTDQPRSSSEQYLLDWEPWYLQWLPLEGQGHSRYAGLADALARDLGLADTEAALRGRRRELEAQLESLDEEESGLRAAIQRLRTPVRDALEARWPGARYGYTLAFKRFLERDLDEAQAFIMAHEQYAGMVAAQDGYYELSERQLELEREWSALARVEYLQRLDRILTVFPGRASPSEQAEYERLLDCEQAPL